MSYMAFKDFYFYKKTAGVNVNNFLVQYEFLYQRLCKFRIIWLEGVQAFFVLNMMNVSLYNI